GPQLIADTGNRLRGDFLAATLDVPAQARSATSALAGVRRQAPQYASSNTDSSNYPAESSWLSMVATQGAPGLASAMRAYGYRLCRSNFFPNVGLAWQALRAVGNESPEAVDYAEAIESGSITATLAVAEQSGSWDPALVRAKAIQRRDGWQLAGEKLFVPGADGADVYFVVARSVAGPSLFAVERFAPGLQVVALSVLDETRPLCRVQLSDTPARLVGTEGGGGRLMMGTIDLATTALAGEQVGLIEQSMSLLAAAGPRDAELADVTLQHVAADALWRRAVNEQATRSPDASPVAAAAHIGCSRAAMRAATVTARLLGPSGDTDALFKRALSANLLFGGPALSHERLLERLGI
uniref:acyl-CoA dehydrogenase family protein n=1 Tax=uncultured Mycobacterium sp. TaxID=171292 RepID=UPI0035CB0D8C